MAVAIRGSVLTTSVTIGAQPQSQAFTSAVLTGGDILVIVEAMNGATAFPAGSTPTGGTGLSWTQIVDEQNTAAHFSRVTAWWSAVPSDQTSTITCTITASGGSVSGAAALYRLTGAAASPAGQTGVFQGQTDPTGSNLQITGTLAGSLIVMGASDWSAGTASLTISISGTTGGTTDLNNLESGQFRGVSASGAQSSSTNQGTLDYSAATGDWAAILFEIKAAPVGGSIAFASRPGQTWVRRYKHPQRLPLQSVSGPQNYQQSLSGGLSFTGSLTKATSTSRSGGLSFTGSFTKQTSHLLSGGLSFTGSLARRIGKTLSGGLSFTGSQNRAISKLLSGGLSFTGSQNRAMTHSLSGGLSFTGTLTKRTSRALSGTLSFTGSLATAAVHLFTQSLSGALSFTGSFTKQTSKSLSGGLSFAGSLIKSTAKQLTGGLSFAGSQTRRTSSGQSGGLSFTGSLTKRTSHLLSGGLSFTGSLATAAVHLFTKALSGGLSFTGSFTKQTNKNLSGVLSFTGSISRRIGKALSGGLSFTGSLPRRIVKGIGSTLSFVGSLVGVGGSAPPGLGGNVHGPSGNLPAGMSGTASGSILGGVHSVDLESGNVAGTGSGNIPGNVHGPSSPGEGGTIS